MKYTPRAESPYSFALLCIFIAADVIALLLLFPGVN